jgi:archaellum component FlaF (FlaF/FlaG flagellin family)
MVLDAQTAAVIASIAAVVNAVAALVSLLVALGALYVQSQAGKPRVHVKATAAMVAAATLGPPRLSIEAQYRGLTPVTITSAGFDLSGGRTAPILNPREITGAQAIPRPLQPGEAVSIVFDFVELATIDREASVRGVR